MRQTMLLSHLLVGCPTCRSKWDAKFSFQNKARPTCPTCPTFSLRHMRKNEVDRDICAPYGKERSLRPKWDRWDGIDFERLFLSYLGLEVGRAAKWDSGQTKRGTRMDAPLFHNLEPRNGLNAPNGAFGNFRL